MEPYVSSSSAKKKKKSMKKSQGDPYGAAAANDPYAATATTAPPSDPYGSATTATTAQDNPFANDPYASTATTAQDDPYAYTAPFTAASRVGNPKSSSSKKKKKKSSRHMSSKKSDDSSNYDSNSNYDSKHVVFAASGWDRLPPPSGVRESSDGAGGLFKYAVTGHESQIVTVAVPPGQTCQGEPGSMMYLSAPIQMKVTCGSDWFGRCCGGEDCCIVNFTNNTTNEVGYAALTTNDPLAKVVPVDMSSPDVAGTLIVQQGAYMASYGDVQISYDCDCNLVRCCCGGMGLVRQKITGTGTAFLGATGTIVQKVLQPNEVMLVDTNCILAYSESCEFDLKKTGGIVNWIGGGEGFFNSTLKGPGLAIVQSMNMRLLLESLAAEKMYRR